MLHFSCFPILDIQEVLLVKRGRDVQNLTTKKNSQNQSTFQKSWSTYVYHCHPLVLLSPIVLMLLSLPLEIGENVNFSPFYHLFRNVPTVRGRVIVKRILFDRVTIPSTVTVCPLYYAKFEISRLYTTHVSRTRVVIRLGKPQIQCLFHDT